jgi:signal transduction histidine kinase/ligand-binding sensor domain-containing protein
MKTFANYFTLFCMLLASCNGQPGKVAFPFKETEFKKPETVNATPTIHQIPDSLASAKYTSEKGELVTRDQSIPLKKPIKKKAGKPKITESILNKRVVPLSAQKRLAGTPKKVKIKGKLVSARGKIVKASQPITKTYMPPAVSDQDTYGFRYLSQDQNLPGTAVYALLEDRHGRIWIGTDNGLAMLEGGEIKIFTAKEGLINNNITSLLESATGAIWIGTDGGVDVFESGSFTHYGVEEGLSNNFVSSLLESATGAIWIGSDGGVDVFQSDSFTHYGVEEGLSNNRVRSLLESATGAIWIGIQGGVEVIESDSLIHYGVEEGLSSNLVLSLLESDSGAIWIGTYGGGVDVFQSGSFIHYGMEEGLSSNYVVSLLESASGDIWIGTDGGGVDVVQSGRFLHYGEEEGLSYNGILSLLESSSGAIWIGTYGGGVDVFQSGSFIHYGMEEGLGNDFVVSLLESSSGAIWIGDNGGGLDVFESDSFFHYGTGEGLSDNYISSLLESTTGAIWIGSDGGGIDVFESGSFTHYGTEQGLSNNYVTSLLEDDSKAIWIGTDGGGVNVFESGGFIHYGIEEGLSNNTVRGLMESATGAIWIGTDGGIDVFELGSFTHYGTQEGLSNNTIRSLLEDTSGAIWIGTSGGGVDVFESGDFTHYGTEEGLPDNAVLQLAMDSLGNVWAGTGKGLTRFVASAEGYELTNWNKTHGLKYMDFNSPGNPMLFTQTDQVSKKGTMWSGVGSVLTAYEPPLADTLKPELFLTGIDIGQKLVDWSKVSSLKEKMQAKEGVNRDTLFFPNRDSVLLLSNFPPDTNSLTRAGIQWTGTEDLFPYYLPLNLELPYDQNHLTFHYSGMKLNEEFDVVYRYMLEGLDTDWSPFTKEGKADYRNIPPGTYIFKVRARGRNFLWSEEERISFVVYAPWWLLWWVKLLWVALFITILYSIYKIRVNGLNQQKKNLEIEVGARTKEVELQRDEILIQAEELRAANSELENSLSNLKKTQNQLAHSDKMASLGVLSAGIGHEINNPLNFIQGGAHGIAGELSKDEINKTDINDLLNIIYEGVKRAKEIVKSLSRFSRSGDDQMAECEVHEIIDHCLVMLNNKFKHKVEVHKSYCSQKPLISGNDSKLHQLFLNVLTNAEQAIDVNGNIYIDTSIENTNLIITIKDDGCGISDENLSKILDPFFTTKPPGEGTGLGLSITHNIIQEHGGEIAIKSKFNLGTEILMKMPVL